MNKRNEKLEQLKEERLGQARKMNNGQNAKIAKYDCYTSIDVEFEDGTIVRNKTYNNFKKGSIKNPNQISSLEIANEYIGKTKMMKCGMECTIIAFRQFRDIDVQFKDETIIKNRQYVEFKKGSILNPNYDNRTREQPKQIENRNKYIGYSKTMNCGKVATIIKYNKYSDIDIIFDDGVIIQNASMGNFKIGTISHPNQKTKRVVESIEKQKEERVGETRTMNCGMKATIIKYNSSSDIDVQFEDGYISKNKGYNSFIEGSIHNKNMHHHNFIDLKGLTFGNWTVLEQDREKTEKNKKSRKIYWKCLCKCGNIKFITTEALKGGYSLSCGCINMSYPNIFVNHFLQQLGMQYESEKTFTWSERKRYDFYISEKSLIIEAHGIQHYEDWHYSTFEEQHKNDLFKEEMAINNGIKNYIQLDCRKSNFNFIKDSIINSGISKIFDLSNFDWELLQKNILEKGESV